MGGRPCFILEYDAHPDPYPLPLPTRGRGAASVDAKRRSLVLAALLASLPAPILAAPASEPVSFDALPGFASDDLGAALRAFRASCGAARPTRAAVPPPPGLAATCAAAAKVARNRAAARAFFERYFIPRRIEGAAFFTGYYEPVVDGALRPDARFATPLYAPPPGLTTVAPGRTQNLDPTLNAARRLPDGRLVALPDRAAIETGALGRDARPLVYVASPAEAFFIQVQGSARIRLPEGRLRRLVFAGRNGYPYTSIGKLLVQRLGIPPSQMGMTQLRAWIAEQGQGPDDAGTKLMRENRSYIFFRFDETLGAQAGPIGGEGISLTAGRSLAIDRSLWPYGLPFFLDTTRPDATPLRRLMVAQDTGAAILGPARADIFLGSGAAAANEAGALRQPGTLYVLWPKP